MCLETHVFCSRVQKHRAAHSEEAVEQANLKLMERDAMMADMRSQIDGLMTCLDKISKEKSQALAENSAFKTYVVSSLSSGDRFTEIMKFVIK